MAFGEHSSALARRLLRDVLIVTALTALVAGAVWGGRAVGGVAAGGALAAYIVWGARRTVARVGVDPSTGTPSGASARRLAFGLAVRQVLLVAAGYVIIGRLRLHPLGVLAGVSAVVVAVTAEAVRAWRRPHLQ